MRESHVRLIQTKLSDMDESTLWESKTHHCETLAL